MNTLRHLLIFLLFLSVQVNAQNPSWTHSIDSTANLSSARMADLNNDGIKDIVFGAGVDGLASTNGIIAVNGSNGSLLWKRPSRNEVFGSAAFQDITNDNIPDVFITGRQAQMLAINGANGELLWDYFPYNVNPADSGLYNFYNPCFVNDVTNDGINDILVSNGGDHAAPVWDTDRPAGRIMLLDAANGNLITQAIVPDSAEIYCSPVVADVWNDNNPWIFFGTGGETLGGHFYACRLSNFLQGSLASSTMLAEDSELGFIAPASVVKETNGTWKVFIQGYGGTIRCIDGASFTTLWSTNFTGTESSSALALGNFTGSLHTDAFAVVYKGEAPSYSDFYQIMLDGEDGSVQFIDSIGSIHFASANAVDLNNDGLDEAIVSTNSFSNGCFRNSVLSINFFDNSMQELIVPVAGVNLASTPLIADLNNDAAVELLTLTRRDSLNPTGIKGVSLRKYTLNSVLPNAGISWAAYMGTQGDGHFTFTAENCGFGSLSNGASTLNPTCNGLENGSINPSLAVPSNAHTFLWSNGATTQALGNIPAGSYSLRIVNNQGCYEEITYSLQNPYVVSFGGTMPPTCPGGNNGTATINSSGCQCMFSTCTFLWDNGATAKTNSALPEGWSTVTIYHPDGCEVTDSVFITAAPSAIEDVITTDVSCSGSSTAAIELTPSTLYPPISYDWSTGSNASTLSNLGAGIYEVVVTDVRGCIDTLTFGFENPESLNLSALGIQTSCSGMADGSISVNATGGVTPYTWIVNGNTVPNLENTFAPGVYLLRIEDAVGCQSALVPVTILEPEPLTAVLISTPELTANTFSGSATASVSGGTPPYAFTWNDPNSQNEATAVYLNTGWYEISISDASGCIITDSVFVDANSTGISVQHKPDAVSAYPNPTNGQVNLSFPVDLITLYDATGRVLLSQKATNALTLENFSRGIYILEMHFNNKITRSYIYKTN
jgi:hypothetical protein